MRPYAIGLDVGITSVGWATLALDEKETPCGIIGIAQEYLMLQSNQRQANLWLHQEEKPVVVGAD